ncbi:MULTISPECIES: bssS family protein [Achromobacter]|uniref:bssS family protein n=1 Tax=Achromobacter TaxID=222 RepID=UPI00137914F4|nr:MULTISPECIES: bssS family protein [Achromobacter]
MAENIPLFPVASWTAGPVPQLGLAVIKFDFLTNPMQRPEEANPGRHYALTPAQLRDLIEQMQSALQKLESGAPQGQPGPTH